MNEETLAGIGARS